MAIEVYYLGFKQPAEAYYISFLFKSLLRSYNIETAVITAHDADSGADVTATITEVAKQVTRSHSVDVWVKGGTDGHTYKITCSIHASDNSDYILNAMLPVVAV
jgi:hypothetical protein